MNSQSFIDELFQQWLKTNSKYANEKFIINGYNKFKNELISNIKNTKPTCFNQPNIDFQLKSLEFFERKGERPYIWDGDLGLWFTEKIKTNELVGKLYKLWNKNFNVLNEYKEWCSLYNCEPKLIKFNNKTNMANLEYRLAVWGNQIKELNSSHSLNDEKRKQIDDTLGSWFDWNHTIDTGSSNKKRREMSK